MSGSSQDICSVISIIALSAGRAIWVVTISAKMKSKNEKSVLGKHTSLLLPTFFVEAAAVRKNQTASTVSIQVTLYRRLCPKNGSE